MKKLLVIFLVLSIVLMIFNIAAFADTAPSSMTNKEYYSAQSYLIDKYCDGEITFEQFQEQSQAITNEYVTANTVGGVLQGGALNASNTVSALSQKVGSTVNKYGDEARGYISDWWNGVCNKKGVPTETTQTSNMDMRGYGALALFETERVVYYYYSDYIVIDLSDFYDGGNGYLKYKYTRYGNIVQYNDWSKYDSSISSWSSSFYGSSVERFDDRYKFYGDVRNADGTTYPTDDEYTFSTVKKYDEMTEKQLEDLINGFSDKMTLESPDLSSLEGLLNAIYARLGTLDSDNDNGFLTQINDSILALNGSINDLSTSIETSLNDLKETVSSLVSGGSDDSGTDKDTGIEKHEIAGTLYNVIPLEKNWLQKITHDNANLHVEYQGKQYYLEDDGTLKLGDKYYNVDMNYASTLDEILYTLLDIRDSVNLLTEEEKKMSFDDFFDLKLTDLKNDFDENFAFKDNLKDFLSNIFDEFEKSVPKYESGD